MLPNGKIDRRGMPAPEELKKERMYEEPRTEVEETLAGIWADVLGLEKVGVTDNFFELGGDSILGIQIVARANRAGIHFAPKLLFQFQTVSQLAAAASASRLSPARRSLVSGALPLTAIQRRFFDQSIPDFNHFNQGMLVELHPELDLALLERSFSHLLSHHDALRMRFYPSDGGWRQVNLEREDQEVVRLIDLSHVPEDQLKPAIEANCEQLQRSLDITQGPVIRVGLMKTREGLKRRMLIVAHHLVIDGVSWRILLEDLDRAYSQLERGEEVDLGDKSMSFKEWSEREEEKADGEELERELSYWEEEVGIRLEEEGEERSKKEAGNEYGSVEVVTVALSEEETRKLIKEAPRAYNTRIDELLMSGMAEGYRRWSGKGEMVVEVEGHGREGEGEEDVERTVGWFTVIYPMRIRMEEGELIGELIKRVKEQMRGAPGKGRGYGLMRYVSGKEEVRERVRRVRRGEISFNYLGQFDQVIGVGKRFERGRERSGQAHCPLGIRPYLIDVSAIIIGGQLQVSWLYSRNVHLRSHIERLAWSFIDSLRHIIEHCLSPDAGGITPSDFPEAGLSQEELEKLLVGLNDLTE
jgi:non-ribosomal peptide synthase protein (TIGR01720 family)